MREHLLQLLHHPQFEEGRHWRRQRYPAGSTIIREGATDINVYLVLAGRVRVLGSVRLGGERRMRPGIFELGEGEVFGELALFDPGPRSATVVAVVDCELAVLDGPSLLAFLDGHPEEGYGIMKDLVVTLVGRLRGTSRKLLAVLAWGVQARGIDRHL